MNELDWIQDICDVHLTKDEQKELYGLEYVLTHGYSDNVEKDTNRLNELSDRRWRSLNRT